MENVSILIDINSLKVCWSKVENNVIHQNQNVWSLSFLIKCHISLSNVGRRGSMLLITSMPLAIQNIDRFYNKLIIFECTNQIYQMNYFRWQSRIVESEINYYWFCLFFVWNPEHNVYLIHNQGNPDDLQLIIMAIILYLKERNYWIDFSFTVVSFNRWHYYDEYASSSLIDQ